MDIDVNIDIDIRVNIDMDIDRDIRAMLGVDIGPSWGGIVAATEVLSEASISFGSTQVYPKH